MNNAHMGQAIREGWSIFDADGILELQRIDCPEDTCVPVFESDCAALQFVTLQADAGSEYHREALALVGQAVPIDPIASPERQP